MVGLKDFGAEVVIPLTANLGGEGGPSTENEVEVGSGELRLWNGTAGHDAVGFIGLGGGRSLRNKYKKV